MQREIRRGRRFPVDARWPEGVNKVIRFSTEVMLLAVASNVLAVVLCVAVIVPGGFLFWKLIRAMARIQMPTRRPT